jgi:hypothetical protein
MNIIIHIFDLENEGKIFVLKVGIHLQVWATSRPGRPQSGLKKLQGNIPVWDGTIRVALSAFTFRKFAPTFYACV